MRQKHRLREQDSFAQIFKKGRKTETLFFSLYVMPNDFGYIRFAGVVSSRVSKKAVVRNRLRRRIREWVRTHLSIRSWGVDIVVIVKKDAVTASRRQLYGTLDQAFAPFFR